MHIALVGDSTLDNESYTDGGPSVTDHLRAILGPGSSVTLVALDGATTHQVPFQLERLPSDVSHVVLSVGGNDALGYIEVLGEPAVSVSDALTQLSQTITEFERAYQSCLRAVLAHDMPTTICTIYNGAFPDADQQQVITTTVRLFDDVIIQAAMRAKCPVVDLRQACNEPEDYWDPIEPNARGGAKIAAAIASSLGR